MSMDEVNSFLKKYKGQTFTSKQIAEMLGSGHKSVQRGLMRLKHHNEVEVIKTKERNICVYRYKE